MKCADRLQPVGRLKPALTLLLAQRRGLAMGLNEFAGYGAVAVAAWACAAIASSHGLRVAPFVLGVAFSSVGLILSILFVRDTTEFAHAEARDATDDAPLLRDRTLLACNQAGLVNNLNDGAAWGLFPLLFVSGGVSVAHVGALTAIYPAVWGISQVGTGALSDRWGRKWLIVSGMWIQALGIWLVAGGAWIWGSVLLGFGTALVYPSLLAAVSDRAHPRRRASAVGVYRLWRDLGYAIGAVLSGVVADAFGVVTAVLVVGALTCLSGVVVAVLYRASS